MFGIGGQELIFIILLALILIGPSKLPEIAKTFGKVMGEFQRASNDLKKEIDLAAQEKPQKQPGSEPKPDTEPEKPAQQNATVQPDTDPEKGKNLADEPAYRPEEIER